MIPTNKKILITGGATGIGAGLASRLLENNRVIICGRRKDVLDDFVQRNLETIPFICDLSLASERIRLFEWVKTNHPDLNVLINNAGIQQWMKLSDPDFFQRAEQEIAINILAPVHIASLFIQLNHLDTIMNVTSGLAFSPLIKTPVYSATKAFFHSFTLSLRAMILERKIEVIEIIPPALNTDLGGKGLHDQAPPVSDFIDAIFKQMEAGKNELTFGFSEAMAKAGPEALNDAFKRMNSSL
jgi:uncharacterized oxidoreductase